MTHIYTQRQRRFHLLKPPDCKLEMRAVASDTCEPNSSAGKVFFFCFSTNVRRNSCAALPKALSVSTWFLNLCRERPLLRRVSRAVCAKSCSGMNSAEEKVRVSEIVCVCVCACVFCFTQRFLVTFTEKSFGSVICGLCLLYCGL